ncbi:MAG: Gfo/Idh/MocA family protein [Anaerolineae bacterium]
MLRIAVLGAGWAGTRQAQAIRELGRKVEIACLVDSDKDFLERKANELNVDKTYTDYRAALDDPGVDAVSICLPHRLHLEATLAAASAHKHVLCEKPIAMTVAEATRMIEAADAQGIKLYVAENAVYTSRAKMLREIVATGRYIGELTFASSTKGFQAPDYGYPGRRAWLSTPQAGGSGAWLLNGIHSVAELRFVLGEVATVYMREHKAGSFKRQDVEGTMYGLLTLENGLPVSIAQTAETHLVHNLRGYVLYGDEGTVRSGREGIEAFSKALDPDEKPVFYPYPEEPLSSYAQEIEAFADYVAGAAAGPTTARSERRSLAIVEAGYKSAERGVPIDLEEEFGPL